MLEISPSIKVTKDRSSCSCKHHKCMRYKENCTKKSKKWRNSENWQYREVVVLIDFSSEHTVRLWLCVWGCMVYSAFFLLLRLRHRMVFITFVSLYSVSHRVFCVQFLLCLFFLLFFPVSSGVSHRNYVRRISRACHNMYGNGSIMIAMENSDTRVPVVCYLAVVVRIENKEMHFKCLENIRSKIVSIFFLSTKNDQLEMNLQWTSIVWRWRYSPFE